MKTIWIIICLLCVASPCVAGDPRVVALNPQPNIDGWKYMVSGSEWKVAPYTEITKQGKRWAILDIVDEFPAGSFRLYVRAYNGNGDGPILTKSLRRSMSCSQTSNTAKCTDVVRWW